MNHSHLKHRSPAIPPPPALPRFSLPHEAYEQVTDPLDAAPTTELPALSAASARRVVRRSKAVPVGSADTTSEVALEDILLEAYAEDPPPPMTRRSPTSSDARAPSPPAAVRASEVPPPPVQCAAVDALPRASDPALLPPLQPPLYAWPSQGHAPFGAPGYLDGPGYGPADYESPSVAPVELASIGATIPATPLARAVVANGRPPRRGAAVAVWTVVLLALCVAIGGAAVLSARNATYARLRDRARSAAARAGAKTTAPPAVAPSAPSVPVVAPAVTSAEPVVPAVSIDSLPEPTIGANESLVTFPSYASGHRVFVDGRVIPLADDGAPATLRCGRHMLKVGSARKARVVDLPCGREVTLE